MNRRDLLKAAAACLLITPTLDAQQPRPRNHFPPDVRPRNPLEANMRIDVLVATMCTDPSNGIIPDVEFTGPYFRMYALIENRNQVPVTVDDLFVSWTERGVERDRSDIGGVEGGAIMPGERRFVSIRIDQTPDVRWAPERMRNTLVLGNAAEAQLTPEERAESAAIVTAQAQVRIRDVQSLWPFGASFRLDNRSRHACVGVTVLAVSKRKNGRIANTSLFRFQRIPPGIHNLTTETYDWKNAEIEPPQIVECDFVTTGTHGLNIEPLTVVVYSVGVESVVDPGDITPGLR